MTRRPTLRILRHGSRWLYRLATLALVGVLLLGGGAALLLRYWVLPGIDQYRPQIEAALSAAARQRITLGAVEGEWDGLRPRLTLRDVRVFDHAGVERLVLAKVDGTLSWATLLAGELRFHALELTGLSLEARRDRTGAWLIAGMPLGVHGGGDRGFGDWLLEQYRIAVHDSTLHWIDETLGGAPLLLSDVQLEVERRFGAHRFGLRATPPLDVAAPLDLRGELRRPGRHASGNLYLQVSYADVAALRQWLPLPVDASRGAGALEIWMALEDGVLSSISAEVALSEVSVRLGSDLPALELSRLSGRLGWAANGRNIAISASNLAFTTPDGLRLPPAGLRYRRWGAPDEPAVRSELRFDTLDLAAVTRLVDRLPIDPGVRARLTQMNPRGTLRGFEIAWSGPWSGPGDYRASGAFERVAVAPSGYLPGFSSASGQLQADQRGGNMSIRAERSELAMPRVFVGPLPLDSMAGTVAWSMQPHGPLVRIEGVTFANPHLAGKVAGTYRAVPGQPGSVDLTGSLERGDGRETWRYVPLRVHERIRDWVREAIVSGQTRDVQFRLRGDLRHFPFADGKSGVFEVLTRFEGGTLRYAPGWPAFEGLRGELLFHNASMTLTASAASVYGTQLASGRATIADLSVPDPVLELRAETEGPTEDTLRFIEHSPVDRMIGGFSRGMKASGRGALVLALALPLKRPQEVRVNGRYRFAGNGLDPGRGVPRVEQLSGQLLFTEREVSLRDGNAVIMGMPARLVADRAGPGALVIRGEGRAEAAGLRQAAEHAGVAALGGAADWQGTLTIKNVGYDFVIESDLRGLSSALPAPLAKEAAAPMPFRLQRRSVNDRHELLVLTIGNAVSAQLLRARNASASVLRGEVRVNAPAPTPERDGLWLAGKLERLDLDRWRGLVGGARSALPILSGLDLRVAELRAFGREWHDVALQVSATPAQWQGSLASREAAGTLFWTPAGPGALTGRFTRLHLLPPAPEMRAAPDGEVADYPALDVTAEDFRLGERQLGRLTLIAIPENGEWRIRQLDLRNPEGTVSMKGVWQPVPAPLTRMEVSGDVNDIGRYFARLKLPQGIKGGSARVQGQLSWNGSPQAVDWPTLAGELRLDARKGQFLKVEPGIGKLIGVVSLQALPRRVALDFRDVFSEGFAFDQISGTAAISRGVARTQDFSMAGTSARVEMKGEVSLVGETQRLDVKVVPSMSESVALGAAIVNPAVGIATLLAQKALKDPIGAMVAFEYEVSGTWDDPMVMKKRREQRQQQQGRK
jgi:uncharacterized protein (TIGR02099 family)